MHSCRHCIGTKTSQSGTALPQCCPAHTLPCWGQQLPKPSTATTPRAPSHGPSVLPELGQLRPLQLPSGDSEGRGTVPTQNLSTIHSITQESHPEIAHY